MVHVCIYNIHIERYSIKEIHMMALNLKRNIFNRGNPGNNLKWEKERIYIYQ